MKNIKFKMIIAMFALISSVTLAYGAGAKTLNDTFQVIQGKAGTYDMVGDVADILVANPSVADVGVLRTDRLYIVGKSVGETNILAYDEYGNQLANINVHVRVDDDNIQDTIRAFFPNEDISAKTVKDDIVLTGNISNPSISNQVRDLASRFLKDSKHTVVDLMNVKGEQQVMMKVRMVEIERSALREIGMQMESNLASDGTLARGFGFASNDVGLTSTTPFGSAGLMLANDKVWGPLNIRMNALEEKGLLNVLAEPNLTAISGETAGFLAGGEFPIPVARDTQGNITLEFKQFGVSLNFTPTVMSKERIALHLSTEVSEKDSNNGVTLVDTQIDGLRVRRAETTVEMASGNTIMIAGLIKSDSINSLSGFPGLQDIPVLGELFKSKSFQRNESELLIMVTPYLVKPYAEAEAILKNTPDDKVTEQLKGMIKDNDDTPSMAKNKDGIYTSKNREINLSDEKPKTIKVPEVEAIKLYKQSVESINSNGAELKKSSEEIPLEKRAAYRKVEYIREGEGNKLSKSYASELKRIYGSHVPEDIADAKLGYIVD